MLAHQVLVSLELAHWGDAGYQWIHNEPELAEANEPWRWLYEHAQGEWYWDMVGNPTGTCEVININNYYRIEDAYFRFYFELTSDAVLFKLTWS